MMSRRAYNVSGASQGNTVRSQTRTIQPFVYVLVSFVAFRLMAVLLLKPGGYITALSDFTFYRYLASYASQGFYPSVHYWMEYQPIFPWIPVGIYRLSLLLPNWGDPGFWFNILLGAFFMLSETANLVLLFLIGRQLHGPEVAVRIAWIYSLLFVPLLIMLGWFDVFALTFLLLALYLMLIDRPLASGAVAGLGFLVKLLPIIVVPVAFWREPSWRRRALLVAVSLLTIVAVALPFFLLNPELFSLSWSINFKRSSWETVWALLEGFTGYGLAGGGNRFDPAEAGALQHPSTLPWGLISAGFALVYLWLWAAASDKLQAARNEETEATEPAAFRAVAFTGLTLNLVTLYLKGYSPQFIVWLLPFILLLLPGLRGLIYALLLSAVNLVESPLYFTLLPDQTWLLTGAVLARTALLILLAVEYGRMALASPISRRWSRRLCVGAAALLGILGLVAMPFAYNAYYQNRLATSPYRPVVETLRADAASGARVIVGGDEPSGVQGVFDATYPFLQARFDVTSVQTDWWFPDWQPRLARAVEGHAQTSVGTSLTAGSFPAGTRDEPPGTLAADCISAAGCSI
jgi:Glycosyltransferase family 87